MAADVSRDSLVRISGKVFSAIDSSTVQASIIYQKLPYYDDMGTAVANANEGYEMFMIQKVTYIVSINAEGFDPWEGEMTVADDGSGNMKQNFFITPDADHQIIKLDNLIFASGKSRITSDSYDELDELVKWLEARPSKRIQLEGHTDFAGNDKANMQLSLDRVEAVKEYLTNKGINKKRVLTKAFGGTQPVTRERTAEAKAKNRRVEVRILKE